MRKTEFTNDEYYHIYNRGVDKRKVFCEEGDYLRFLISMKEFNDIKPAGSLYEKSKQKRKPLSGFASHLEAGTMHYLIKIICYCLNPNHYHFIIKQLQNNGISKFMHKLNMGYTHYFNIKYNRSGSLFQ